MDYIGIGDRGFEERTKEKSQASSIGGFSEPITSPSNNHTQTSNQVQPEWKLFLHLENDFILKIPTSIFSKNEGQQKEEKEIFVRASASSIIDEISKYTDEHISEADVNAALGLNRWYQFMANAEKGRKAINMFLQQSPAMQTLLKTASNALQNFPDVKCVSGELDGSKGITNFNIIREEKLRTRKVTKKIEGKKLSQFIGKNLTKLKESAFDQSTAMSLKDSIQDEKNIEMYQTLRKMQDIISSTTDDSKAGFNIQKKAERLLKPVRWWDYLTLNYKKINKTNKQIVNLTELAQIKCKRNKVINKTIEAIKAIKAKGRLENNDHLELLYLKKVLNELKIERKEARVIPTTAFSKIAATSEKIAAFFLKHFYKNGYEKVGHRYDPNLTCQAINNFIEDIAGESLEFLDEQTRKISNPTKFAEAYRNELASIKQLIKVNSALDSVIEFLNTKNTLIEKRLKIVELQPQVRARLLEELENNKYLIAYFNDELPLKKNRFVRNASESLHEVERKSSVETERKIQFSGNNEGPPPALPFSVPSHFASSASASTPIVIHPDPSPSPAPAPSPALPSLEIPSPFATTPEAVPVLTPPLSPSNKPMPVAATATLPPIPALSIPAPDAAPNISPMPSPSILPPFAMPFLFPALSNELPAMPFTPPSPTPLTPKASTPASTPPTTPKGEMPSVSEINNVSVPHDDLDILIPRMLKSFKDAYFHNLVDDFQLELQMHQKQIDLKNQNDRNNNIKTQNVEIDATDDEISPEDPEMSAQFRRNSPTKPILPALSENFASDHFHIQPSFAPLSQNAIPNRIDSMEIMAEAVFVEEDEDYNESNVSSFDELVDLESLQKQEMAKASDESIKKLPKLPDVDDKIRSEVSQNRSLAKSKVPSNFKSDLERAIKNLESQLQEEAATLSLNQPNSMPSSEASASNQHVSSIEVHVDSTPPVTSNSNAIDSNTIPESAVSVSLRTVQVYPFISQIKTVPSSKLAFSLSGSDTSVPRSATSHKLGRAQKAKSEENDKEAVLEKSWAEGESLPPLRHSQHIQASIDNASALPAATATVSHIANNSLAVNENTSYPRFGFFQLPESLSSFRAYVSNYCKETYREAITTVQGIQLAVSKVTSLANQYQHLIKKENAHSNSVRKAEDAEQTKKLIQLLTRKLLAAYLRSIQAKVDQQGHQPVSIHLSGSEKSSPIHRIELGGQYETNEKEGNEDGEWINPSLPLVPMHSANAQESSEAINYQSILQQFNEISRIINSAKHHDIKSENDIIYDVEDEISHNNHHSSFNEEPEYFDYEAIVNRLLEINKEISVDAHDEEGLILNENEYNQKLQLQEEIELKELDSVFETEFNDLEDSVKFDQTFGKTFDKVMEAVNLHEELSIVEENQLKAQIEKNQQRIIVPLLDEDDEIRQESSQISKASLQNSLEIPKSRANSKSAKRHGDDKLSEQRVASESQVSTFKNNVSDAPVLPQNIPNVPPASKTLKPVTKTQRNSIENGEMESEDIPSNVRPSLNKKNRDSSPSDFTQLHSQQKAYIQQKSLSTQFKPINEMVEKEEDELPSLSPSVCTTSTSSSSPHSDLTIASHSPSPETVPSSTPVQQNATRVKKARPTKCKTVKKNKNIQETPTAKDQPIFVQEDCIVQESISGQKQNVKVCHPEKPFKSNRKIKNHGDHHLSIMEQPLPDFSTHTVSSTNTSASATPSQSSLSQLSSPISNSPSITPPINTPTTISSSSSPRSNSPASNFEDGQFFDGIVPEAYHKSHEEAGFNEPPALPAASPLPANVYSEKEMNEHNSKAKEQVGLFYTAINQTQIDEIEFDEEHQDVYDRILVITKLRKDFENMKLECIEKLQEIREINTNPEKAFMLNRLDPSVTVVRKSEYFKKQATSLYLMARIVKTMLFELDKNLELSIKQFAESLQDNHTLCLPEELKAKLIQKRKLADILKHYDINIDIKKEKEENLKTSIEYRSTAIKLFLSLKNKNQDPNEIDEV